MQTTLGRFLGRSSIDTLEEWAAAVRQSTGGAIAVEHLCRTDEETLHWASVDGDRRHFLCFYDAVILAALVDQPVDIHIESPAGAAIQGHAVGTDELRVTPEDAVFSFGIADHAGSIPDGEPTLADAYDAICPYVKAFPDRAAYEEWAASVPAATVAMPLSGATDLAAALAR